MEWVKILIEAINVVVWPGVVLTAVVLLRQPLRGLVDPRRVTKLQVGASGLTLERDVSVRLAVVQQRLAQESVEAQTRPSARGEARPSPPDLAEVIPAVAGASPRAAVALALEWLKCEVAPSAHPVSVAAQELVRIGERLLSVDDAQEISPVLAAQYVATVQQARGVEMPVSPHSSSPTQW